jgi:HPt (histidine-containing phosphotransfer) domain-containing protein
MAADDVNAPLKTSLPAESDMAPLVELYVQELPPRIASLESAINQKDPALVRRLAHQLRGSGSSYGFPLITETAQQLEESLIQNAPWEDLANRLLSILRRVTL